MKEIGKVLKDSGVAATPIRILVFQCLGESQMPLSLSELEVRLDSVDKSTISRTLSTLKQHHLIHSFSDGSGSVKYELCHSSDHAHDDDTHVHFRCKKCGETKCLTEIKTPYVELPDGFVKHESSFVITGICSDCSKSQ